MAKRSKLPKMLKQIAVRLLLFGIPFALSYLATRPTTPVTTQRTFAVCTSPGSRPGEVRISLHPDGCPPGGSEENAVPALNIPKRSINPSHEAATIPF
jgi:hypothetical protein